jgi:hypothetical protein
MEDKSLKDIFEDMDKLWSDFKAKTWQDMSVPSATIWETREAD